MGERKLIVISRNEEIPLSYSFLSAHTENGLVYTAANKELHLLLREPALLELARRGHKAVLPICEDLLAAEDSEMWLLALEALVILATPTAIDCIVSLLDSRSSHSRRLMLQMLGRVVTPMLRDKFRHMFREFVIPGVLDISGWTPTAVRILHGLCEEEGIEVVEDLSEVSIPVPNL